MRRIRVFTNDYVVMEIGNMREVTGPWESQLAARNYGHLMGRKEGITITVMRRKWRGEDDE